MFVWLASYPKSGNTWLRLLLESLYNGGKPVDINAISQIRSQVASRSFFDDALGVASSDLTPSEVDEARASALALEAATAGDQPLFVKVHDAWRCTEGGQELFPRNLTQAAFYIVRDPRDVAISFAHHRGIEIDEAITLMANPDFVLASAGQDRLPRYLPQVLFSWSQHVESWLEASQLSPLLLRYEDLLTDSTGCARAVCARLGWEIEEGILNAAVLQTRFESLSQQESQGGFSEKSAPHRVFFRRGKSGVWKDTLTAGQIKRIEMNHGTMMKRLRYL